MRKRSYDLASDTRPKRKTNLPLMTQLCVLLSMGTRRHGAPMRTFLRSPQLGIHVPFATRHRRPVQPVPLRKKALIFHFNRKAHFLRSSHRSLVAKIRAQEARASSIIILSSNASRREASHCPAMMRIFGNLRSTATACEQVLMSLREGAKWHLSTQRSTFGLVQTPTVSLCRRPSTPACDCSNARRDSKRRAHASGVYRLVNPGLSRRR
jgi:hypothetical protein